MTLDIDIALINHLQYNHYPAIPLDFVECCKEAIDACNDGDYDRRIETPWPHRTYGDTSPAWVIAEFAHLDGFIDDVGEEFMVEDDLNGEEEL